MFIITKPSSNPTPATPTKPSCARLTSTSATYTFVIGVYGGAGRPKCV